MVALVYPFRRRRKKLIIIKETFSKKWAVPGLFLFIFAFFKQKLQSLQQINEKEAGDGTFFKNNLNVVCIIF